jgi:cytochrome oxidase Cu insertion factor (SCO1/SenC/PrrC family)
MNMEPAEKNPAELRRTAFKLVGIMIIGAVVVLSAYFAKSKQKAEENEGRPPITTKISRNFAAKNHEDRLVATYDLEGKVWFAVPVCVSQLDENKHALGMMKEIADHYEGNDNLRFVAVAINGVDQGVNPDELKRAMGQLGIDDDRWWFLTTGDTKKQRGYIKDQLRLGIVSERPDKDPAGKWKFPSQIALIDREMHIRQRYDFREAEQFEQAARELLKEKPELKGVEKFKSALNAVYELKKTLFTNIDFVLSETKTGSRE